MAWQLQQGSIQTVPSPLHAEWGRADAKFDDRSSAQVEGFVVEGFEVEGWVYTLRGRASEEKISAEA